MHPCFESEKAFAALFDSSLLGAVNREREYVKCCEDAMRYGFACVAVNGAFIKPCAGILKGSGVNLSCSTSFPLGLCALDVKVAEVRKAIEDGATDIDMVLNISKILDHEYAYIEEEVGTVSALCREAGAVVKFIFETPLLTNGEIVSLCGICNGYKPDFVKASTGTVGLAAVDQIALMRRESLPEIMVKASGGFYNLERVEAAVAAGAVRIGTLAAVETMRQYKAKYGK